jgi:hypothetical protein
MLPPVSNTPFFLVYPEPRIGENVYCVKLVICQFEIVTDVQHSRLKPERRFFRTEPLRRCGNNASSEKSNGPMVNSAVVEES